SGTGLTEYAYQLIGHMKPMLLKKDSIDELYALEVSERNNIRGLIITNTAFKRKIAAIPKNKYDVIHVTDQEIGFIAKIVKNAGMNAKVITTVHDLSRFEKGLHMGIGQKVYNRLVKGSTADAINYSDMILCNSSQTYETVGKMFGKKADIKVVLHGTNDNFFKTPLKEYVADGNKFIVGYIGALMYHKNVAFILNAANRLKRDRSIMFKLYGTGVENKALQSLKSRLKLTNAVFNGHLKEENKVNTYDSFNIFVFPSMYEGLGYPILEAQARGLPVIIYKYGKIPKEVRKYCFEAESPEHMARIIEDLKENSYGEKQRKKATEYARSFTWERCAKETLEVYKKLQASVII
ncbi:glycosyl transferase group 1, partial [mine drainage metagenome]